MHWDCYWTSVAVIGYGRTGKTQLKRRLRSIALPLISASTDTREIHLCRLDPTKKSFVALLDAKGPANGVSAEQADLIDMVVDKARILILVLDHANTERDRSLKDVEPSRLDSHRDFIRHRLIPGLKNHASGKGTGGAEGEKRSPVRAIMVVVNKADLWESGSSVKEIQAFKEEQAKLLKDELHCDTPSYCVAVEKPSHEGFEELKAGLIRLCETNT
jgi:hypothetical protein